MFYLRFRAVCISRNDKPFFPIAVAWNGKSRGTNTGMIRFGRTTDRSIGEQTRSNVANVVIVIGLIFHWGAARRSAATAVMAATDLFEFTKPWKRDYAPVLANGCHIGHRERYLLFRSRRGNNAIKRDNKLDYALKIY